MSKLLFWITEFGCVHFQAVRRVLFCFVFLPPFQRFIRSILFEFFIFPQLYRVFNGNPELFAQFVVLSRLTYKGRVKHSSSVSWSRIFSFNGFGATLTGVATNGQSHWPCNIGYLSQFYTFDSFLFRPFLSFFLVQCLSLFLNRCSVWSHTLNSAYIIINTILYTDFQIETTN